MDNRFLFLFGRTLSFRIAFRSLMDIDVCAFSVSWAKA